MSFRESSASGYGGDAFDDLLEGEATFGRQAQPDGGVVEAEDPGQNLGGKAACHSPRVWLAEVGGQFAALGQRQWCLELRVDQQVVLGEESRE